MSTFANSKDHGQQQGRTGQEMEESTNSFAPPALQLMASSETASGGMGMPSNDTVSEGISQFKMDHSPESIGQMQADVQGRESTQSSEAPGSEPHREMGGFNPTIGTETTSFENTFGTFEAEHGLQSRPTSSSWGGYYFNLEMTPKETTGESEIGFMQVARQSESGGGISLEADDYKMNDYFASLTEQESGWALDRANASRDQTPFYGMYKDSAGDIQQYSTSRVGRYGSSTALLHDVPSVGLTDKMEFTATAMDMSTGREFGAVAWGFEYNEAEGIFREETPQLVDSGSERLQGRDRAVDHWNENIANDNIDQVPGS